MRNEFSKALEQERDAARNLAAEELVSNGFTRGDDGHFLGQLVHNDERISIRVELPPSFPDEPLSIFLGKAADLRRRAHIERNGRICLYPPSGYLTDVTRPAQVVVDSLQRAREVLFGEEDTLTSEFLAYWRMSESTSQVVITTCSLSESKVVAAFTTAGGRTFIADDTNSAKRWIENAGFSTKETASAFLAALTALPEPPEFDHVSTIHEIAELIRAHATKETKDAFERWLKDQGLPATLILTAPSPDAIGHVVFAADLRKATGKAAVAVRKGFRPGRVPAALEVARSGSMPATRFAPTRADPHYLLARGGADARLLGSSVCVVGCGALGSQIALQLASAGVGQLRLIDNEPLEFDNIYRHVLGAAQVGHSKADAMKALLLSKYPHIAVTSFFKRVEEVLDDSSEVLTGSDLIVIALGSETLELRLNGFLRLSTPRVHAWLEPLGLGGHVLAVGTADRPMCFECLFARDESTGLRNMASLAQPGQEFLQTIAGCSGTFAPFGEVDAVQASVEATRISINALCSDAPQPSVTSWISDETAFLAEGLQLSRRGELLQETRREVRDDYARPDCPSCRKAKA